MTIGTRHRCRVQHVVRLNIHDSSGITLSTISVGVIGSTCQLTIV